MSDASAVESDVLTSNDSVGSLIEDVFSNTEKETPVEEPKEVENVEQEVESSNAESEEAEEIDPIQEALSILNEGNESENKEEKAVEEPQEQGEEIDNDPHLEYLDDKGKLNWKRLKSEKVALEKEVKKLKESPQAQSSNAEVDELRKQNEELSAKLKQADFQNHPDFINKIENPIRELSESLNQQIKKVDEGLDLRKLERMEESEMDISIDEIVDNLPKLKQHKFLDGMQSYFDLKVQKESMLENADQMNESYRNESIVRTKQAFDSLYDEITSEENLPLQKLEASSNASDEQIKEIEAYNTGIESIRSDAEKYVFDPLDDRKMSEVAFKAANYDFFVNHSAPRMEQEYQQVVSLLGQVTNQLKNLKSNKPTTRSSVGQAGTKSKNLSTNQLIDQIYG